MHVLLHCNGGARIGVGHVLRSIALAEEAMARGYRVTIAGGIQGQLLDGALESLGLRAQPVDELERLIDELAPDVVHLDTYDEVRVAGGPGQPLLSNMEDAEFGRRPSDLAVDSTLDAETGDRPDVPVSLLLRGTRFAPLRRLVTTRRGAPAAAAAASRVLVLMGGSDPCDLSPQVVSAMASTNRRMSLTVVAPERLHAACRSAAGQLRPRLLSDVVDLPALMVAQDLVVSAAGTSVWELCCLGIPMALVCAVENQQRGYDRVIAHGAAVGLGVGGLGPEAIGTLKRLLDDQELRRDLSGRAAELVDGRGAWRIVTAWEQLLSEPPEDTAPAPRERLQVRAAGVGDADRLLEWRNDPETRRFSRTTEPVSLADHRQWLRRSVSDDERLLLIAADDGGDVGTIRWDRHGDRAWEVSITVAPDRRGERLARPILAAGERALLALTNEPTTAVAAVRTDNVASRRLFTRGGYLRETDPDEDGFAQYVKWLDQVVP